MRRDQLEHAIRTACQIIEQPAVIIIGSQAILGTYSEDQLPDAATMSVEVDVLPIAESNAETALLADQIEGVAGEWSPFEQQHGFSIDGVDMDTAILPDGWRDRLDKEDLCVAKLCAFREKDRNFVAALLDAGLVDADVIATRMPSVPRVHLSTTERALAWLNSETKR